MGNECIKKIYINVQFYWYFFFFDRLSLPKPADALLIIINANNNHQKILFSFHGEAMMVIDPHSLVKQGENGLGSVCLTFHDWTVWPTTLIFGMWFDLELARLEL